MVLKICNIFTSFWMDIWERVWVTSRQRLCCTNKKTNDDDKLMMTCWIVTRCVRNVNSLSSICVRILLLTNFSIHPKMIWMSSFSYPFSVSNLKMNSKLRSFKWGTSSFTIVSLTFFLLVLMSSGCLLTIFLLVVC